jgi:hypothetical protein
MTRWLLEKTKGPTDSKSRRPRNRRRVQRVDFLHARDARGGLAKGVLDQRAHLRLVKALAQFVRMRAFGHRQPEGLVDRRYLEYADTPLVAVAVARSSKAFFRRVRIRSGKSVSKADWAIASSMGRVRSLAVAVRSSL